MSIIIVLSIIGGGALGYFIIPSDIIGIFDLLIPVGLSILMFLCGIDLGKQGDIFKRIKNIGIKAFALPVLCVFGSIIGGFVSGFLISSLNPVEGVVAASGLGWYTLAPFYVEPHNLELSAITFLTNVMREFFGLIIIPIVAKKIGYLETSVVAGAPAMDVCLPVIEKSTNAEITICSFMIGVILSAVVPVLMPFVVTFL